MTRRELFFIAAAFLVALGLGATMYVGAMATDPLPRTQTAALLRQTRPRIFFDLRHTPPPARAFTEARERVPPAFRGLLPMQRGLSDTARDAAGFLLVVLITVATLLLAHGQVVSAYRATLGGWRTHLRVLLTGLAVLGLGASGGALAWIVYLGFVATAVRGAALGVPAALQVGLISFGVLLVLLLLVIAVGFSATAWRLGDALFRSRALSRYQAGTPAAVVAVIGAALLYVVWQIPVVGAAALFAVVAYALGTVVTSRLLTEGSSA